ncbi:MAG: hypothetical protein JO190_12140 [Candidatus Eremiobacteraeota bacterium]|nr:hypothetical protein [Candidatus Eremiobacteraeota bacterium]MBV8497755.1 hypothetical protein [Candidatus Eremiobacteraeota bacterium]
MPKASATPSPQPTGNVLPFDSTVLFVLDDAIASNAARAGQLIRAHLKSALVVGGRTVAPAGAPEQIRIVDASPADITDIYGFVDIYYEPLALPDGRTLPLRAPVARLAPNVSAGHESTVEAEDTVGDIVVPYYSLWQIFRKGKNFVLKAGSELPARTDATISAQPNGTIGIVTPPPLPPGSYAPTSSFPVIPMATPIGGTPQPSRLPTPAPKPSPTPTA